MMTNSPTQIESQKKYQVFKSERKKASPKIQASYFNALNPTISDKALAYQCAMFDETREDDLLDFMLSDLEEACKFDPWRAFLYLQQIAAEMTDLAVRAFRLMLENLKPKPKEQIQMADKIPDEEYEFSFTGNYDAKKFPKGKKQYKRWEMDKSKDKKGQSDYIKELSQRVIESEKGSPERGLKEMAEKNRNDMGMKTSQEALAGKGGCSNATWGDDSGDHFTSCGPSFDYICMSMNF